MKKRPQVIEGSFRRVGEKPAHQPFWGPNAGIGGVLQALAGGCTMVRATAPGENPGTLNKWVLRLLLLFLFLLFSAAHFVANAPH